MAQKTLNAFVVIGGRVDNSFGQIGTQLINLGSTVDEISQKLIDFGKESLEVYKDYEYNMTELETVWGTNGTFQKGSRELKSAMDDMKNAAAEWANTNIFHTNDISNAMVEAAHAGWDYQQMLEGVPAAMSMAQAGGMDLSTAMNYVLKAQKSFGWEFDDITDKMDEWIYAANKSAGTTSEFGDTFLKLGSTVRFAENTEELLALTKVMHDMGTTGSAAGTMIKTSLMRLYAPSGKASKVLEQLGVSAQEIEDLGIMEDQGLIEALDTLEAHGFSAFDSVTGQAKPVLQTYSDLGQALIAISGYTQEANETQQQFYERVLKNQTVMGIMSEVFGIRGIQGSMNILMSLQEATQMYGDLTNNAAAGTTEYVREMMNDTLFGSTELFLSKVEELHRRVGEELAPDVEKIQGWIGGIIDQVTSMDDTHFNSLVSGLKIIAVAGPGLIIAGSALRFIGMLLTPAGAVGMGAATLAAIVASLNEIREMDFQDQFGNMHLDETTLGEYVKTLGEDFSTAFANVNSFAEALNTATENYKTASSTFSSDLLSAVLTKKQFTPEEQAALEQKGIEIYGEVLKAINASGDMAAEFWNALYGGEGTAEYDPKFQSIIDLIGEGQQGLVDQANGVAEKMKAAMLKGFEEGFTEDDYTTILKYFEEYNELIATAQSAAANEELFIQQQKWLHKAQTASLADIQEMAGIVTAQRDTDLADMEDRYLTERARLVYYAKQTGMTDEEAEAYVAAKGVDEKYEAMRSKYAANYDEFLATLWETQIKQSDLGDAYASLGKYASLYMNGTLSAGTALDTIYNLMGGSSYSDTDGGEGTTRAYLGRVMGYMISSMGGEQAMAEKIAYYEQAGNAQMAERMKSLLAMEQLVNGFTTIQKTDPTWLDDLFGNSGFATTGQIDENTGAGIKKQGEYQRNLAMMEGLRDSEYTLDRMRETIAMMTAKNGLAGYFGIMGEYIAGGSGAELNGYSLDKNSEAEFDRIYTTLSQTYDLERVYADMMARDTTGNLGEGNAYREDLAIYDLLYGAASKNTAQYVQPGQTEAGANAYTIEGSADAATAAHTEAQGTLDELGDLTAGVSVTGGTDAASAAYNEMQSYANQHPVTYRSTLTGGGTGGSPFASFALKAKGGRETRPSIFAEAGIPEWYIPEEHTDNTLDLVLAAAYGSGFSILDLAERAGARLFADGGTDGSGSLNWSTLPSSASSGSGNDSGNSGSGSGITVQYSPVIHADNAQGVESVLLADKKRLEKWMEEWWAKRQLYESMVTYQ